MDLPNYFIADLPREHAVTPTLVTEACQTLKRNREKYLLGRTTASIVGVLSATAQSSGQYLCHFRIDMEEPPARAPGGSLERCNQLLGYAGYAGRAPRLGTHLFSAEGAKNLTGRLPGPGPRSAPGVAQAERLHRRHHWERASDMFTRVCAWDRTSFPTWTGRSAASG